MFRLLLLSLAGFVGGFVGSQVGAGAIITLPALLFIGLPLPLAVGTNTISGWLINVVAAFKYWRAGKVSLQFILPLSFVAAVGAFIGARLLFIIQVDVLSKTFAAIFCLLGVALMLKQSTENKTIVKLNGVKLWLAFVLSFVLGLYGGILSVGLSTFAILVFNLVLGQPKLNAIANSIFMAAIMLTASTAYFILNSRIYYPDAIPLAITSVLGSYVGAKFVLDKEAAYFKAMLLLVLTLVIIKLVMK